MWMEVWFYRKESEMNTPNPKMKNILTQAKAAVLGMQEAAKKGEAGESAWQAYKQDYLDAMEQLMDQGLTKYQAQQACNQFLS
jgi:hypothetical protein